MSDWKTGFYLFTSIIANADKTQEDQDKGPLNTIKKRLRQVHDSEVNAEFLDKIANGFYAFLDTYSSAVGRLNIRGSRRQACRFHIGRESYAIRLDAFSYARNSRISVHVDTLVRRLRSFGFTTYLRKRAYALLCDPRRRVSDLTPLSLQQIILHITMIIIMFNIMINIIMIVMIIITIISINNIIIINVIKMNIINIINIIIYINTNIINIIMITTTTIIIIINIIN
ncbi:hypothetical protein FHG87_008562 [Trinorchestia longiramus]|nr:hypothetical protein FHG87_008562 [Trinorchestia longiramus]